MFQNDLSTLMASILSKRLRFTGLNLNGTNILSDSDYMTHQEVNDLKLKKQNHNRPDQSPFTTNFDNRWAA